MNNLLWLNPEFQKSLWLELSPTRLIAAPVIVGLIALALHMAGNQIDANVLVLVLEIMVVFWGSRMATDSITEELILRTWDVHRLSAERATGLVLGKFFGGTSFAWYMGGIAAAISLTLLPQSRADVIDTCAIGLLAQSAAFFSAIALRSGANSRRVHNLVSQAIGLAVAFGLRKAITVADLTHTDIVWFGRGYSATDFFNGLSLLTFAWFMIGSVRLIRRDLGFRDGPAGWSVFIVFLSVMGAGFWSTGQLTTILDTQAQLLRETSSAVLAVAASYIALVGTPTLTSRLTRFVQSMRSGQWLETWREMPPWFAGYGLCIIAVIAGGIRYPGHAAFDVALLGFLARDALVVTGLRLRFQHRAETAITGWFLIAFVLGGYLLYQGPWHDLAYAMGDTTFPKALLPWGEAFLAGLAFAPVYSRIWRAVPLESASASRFG